METIIQRICWNTRGWQLPSGSTYEQGFPSQKGFGHEEWNFQREDVSEGYVYSYTYTKPALAKIEKAGGQFRIVFFAIHPNSKERVVAGIYHSAELVPLEAYDRLYTDYLKRGIFDRRARELCDASSEFSLRTALKEVQDSVRKHWLSVRCREANVESFALYPPLNSIVGRQPIGHRFSRFTYLKGTLSAGYAKHRVSVTPSGDMNKRGPLLEDAYFRESAAKLKIIIPRHKKLSNDFCAWLQKQHNVAAKQEQQRVDVRFDFATEDVLAELKVCYGAGTTKAIREALGQLLEYNHYPHRIAARTWLVVLDDEPSATDREFINVLRKDLALPLSVGWRTGNKFKFHPQWPKTANNALQPTR